MDTQNQRTLRYGDLAFPTYRNSREIGLNFTVEDLIRAAILSGTNILLTGEAGGGKTQAMYDIESYWFGGSEKGNVITTRGHPELDLYNEVFKRLDIRNADIMLAREAVEVAFCGVDEINRTPEGVQNQFLVLGDGIIEFKGRKYRIGKDVGDNIKYVVAMATCNIGDGEYGGTFEIDKALRDRMQLVIEVTHPYLRVPNQEEVEILLEGTSPSVEFNGERDITHEIINAYREIVEMSKNYPLDGLAVLYFLQDGLRQCRKNNDEKYRGFPTDCQDCDKKGNICYMVKPNSMRVLKALKQLSLGMAYVGVLKEGPEYIQAFQDNIAEYLFLLYPFVANGKKVVNPLVLRYDFNDDEFRMLREVAGKLKEEYKKKEDFIMTSIYYALKEGKNVSSFAVREDTQGRQMIDVRELGEMSREVKNKYSIIEPFKDTNDLRWEWVTNDFIPAIIRRNKN